MNRATARALEAYGPAQCRVFSHHWRPWSAKRGVRTRDGAYRRSWYRVELYCLECATRRITTTDSLGRVVGRSYAYQPGYSLADLNVPSADLRAGLRLVTFRRLLEDMEQAPETTGTQSKRPWRG